MASAATAHGEVPYARAHGLDSLEHNDNESADIVQHGMARPYLDGVYTMGLELSCVNSDTYGCKVTV